MTAAFFKKFVCTLLSVLILSNCLAPAVLATPGNPAPKNGSMPTGSVEVSKVANLFLQDSKLKLEQDNTVKVIKKDASTGKEKVVSWGVCAPRIEVTGKKMELVAETFLPKGKSLTELTGKTQVPETKVFLKNGTIVEGEIQSISISIIEIKTKNGMKKLNRNDIEQVESSRIMQFRCPVEKKNNLVLKGPGQFLKSKIDVETFIGLIALVYVLSPKIPVSPDGTSLNQVVKFQTQVSAVIVFVILWHLLKKKKLGPKPGPEWIVNVPAGGGNPFPSDPTPVVQRIQIMIGLILIGYIAFINTRWIDEPGPIMMATTPQRQMFFYIPLLVFLLPFILLKLDQTKNTRLRILDPKQINKPKFPTNNILNPELICLEINIEKFITSNNNQKIVSATSNNESRTLTPDPNHPGAFLEERVDLLDNEDCVRICDHYIKTEYFLPSINLRQREEFDSRIPPNLRKKLLEAMDGRRLLEFPNTLVKGTKDKKPIDQSSPQVNSNPGEFISLLGPVGCGKSTLLKLLEVIEKDKSGKTAKANDPNYKVSTGTTPSAIPTPKDTQLIMLNKAIELNLAKINLFGDRRNTLKNQLQITNLTDKKLSLKIEDCFYMQAIGNAIKQIMLKLFGSPVEIPPNSTVVKEIPTLCASTKLEKPPGPKEDGITYSIVPYPDNTIGENIIRIARKAKALDESGQYNKVPINPKRRWRKIAQTSVWLYLGRRSKRKEDDITKKSLREDLISGLPDKGKKLSDKQNKAVNSMVDAIYLNANKTIKEALQSSN